MQDQIDNLQRQIDEIKKSSTNSEMPIDVREIIRNEVVKDINNDSVPTDTVIMEVGEQIIIPDLTRIKTIIIKWKGKEYNVLYYV